MASTIGTKRTVKSLEGNDLLYHFFQKILLEEDAEQFQALASRLVIALGVWLPPEVYRRYPVLLPYAVRDPKCRGNKRQGLPDEWGSPNAAARFRDDNSLVKGLPRSLLVTNPRNPLLHQRRLGTSFVASHVWRRLADGTEAPRNWLTYSFVPNLVWLPSQLAKLSDREGSFVQTLLQAIARKIYGHVEQEPSLHAIARRAWDLLSERPEARELSLPDVRDLNYFEFEDGWMARRIKTLTAVAAAVHGTVDGIAPAAKVISTRYGEGLAAMAQANPAAAASLDAELTDYLNAVSG